MAQSSYFFFEHNGASIKIKTPTDEKNGYDVAVPAMCKLCLFTIHFKKK